jgi:O-antigen/teichoic acid export membrane protein
MANVGNVVRGRRLAWNSVLNLGSGLLISVLSIVFVPLMLRRFGTELYGILSITWVVLANLGWLDFGFSRASVKFVAHDLSLGRPAEASLWAWTALISQTAMGGIGTCLLWNIAPFVVNHIHVQSTERYLVVLTLRLFAFSIPLDFAAQTLTGVLQVGQRFDWVNGLNLVASIGTFCVYGAGMVHGAHFMVVVYGLFGLKIVNLGAAYWGAVMVLPELGSFPDFKSLPKSYRSHLSPMIRYGSWVAVAAASGPLLLYCDQWIVSVIVGVALLPFYTVPFNLLSRLGLFSSSLTLTLFPAFSALNAKTEWGRIEGYFVRANRYLLTVLIPALFVLFVWAPEILRLWIGSDFAAKATLPFRTLSLGFGIALLAPLSGAVLEAIGRPDLVARLYLIEVPLNVAIVWILTKKFGVLGAAMSFGIRAFAETTIIWIILYKVAPFSWKRFLNEGLLPPSLMLGLMGLGAYVIRHARIQSAFDIGATVAILAAYGACVLVLVLDKTDKALMTELFKNYNSGLSWKK